VTGTVRFGDYDRLWLQSPAVRRESPIYCVTATGKIASAEAAHNSHQKRLDQMNRQDAHVMDLVGK
jgi:hypothetical protein